MDVIVLNESRTGEIIKMWQSTGGWDYLNASKRQKILESLKKLMRATNNNYNIVMWMARCVQRGLLLALKDPKKAARVRQMLNDEDAASRVQKDFKFFVGNEAGALAQMYYDILQTAKELQSDPVFVEVPDIRNGQQQLNADGTPKMKREMVDLVKLLNNVQYTEDATTAQGNRQIDRSTEDVYRDINSVMKDLGDAEKLPKGERIVVLNENEHWTYVSASKCRIEGSMMSHCGNVQYKPGDSIVSLRIRDDGGWFAPHATFIYNKNSNAFGEMKGRHNQKPSKYHKQIVALLSAPVYNVLDGALKLQLLQGGGYLPPNNFSLNDLSEPLFKQLCDANGELIKNQMKNASKVSAEQKLDAQHLKWANEVFNNGTSTIKYMQHQ